MAEVQLNLDAFNRYLNRVVQPYLMKKAEDIAREAEIRAPQGATGELKQSISVERAPRGGAVVRVDAPHAGFVHQGTGPGHIPTPRAAYYPRLRRRGLILWSDSRGGLNPHQVAHGISQKGTPASPFLEESIERVLSRLDFRWIRRQLET